MDTIQDFTANSGNFRNLWATSFKQDEIRSYGAEVGVKVHDLFERHLLKHGRTFLISDDMTIADFKVEKPKKGSFKVEIPAHSVVLIQLQ